LVHMINSVAVKVSALRDQAQPSPLCGPVDSPQ
jgi:hypothetical protein